MNDIQNRIFTMGIGTKKVLDDNSPTITYSTALDNKRILLNTTLAAIPETKQEQERDTTGITDANDDLKQDMALTAWAVTRPLRAWALDNDNKTLAEEIDFSYTDLRYAVNNDAYSRCEFIYEEASDPLVDLSEYGVDPATIASIQTKTLAYGAAIGNPEAAQAIKVAATDDLDKEISNLTKILDGIDDLMAPYRVSEKTFYKTYLSARKINNAGVRHISIRGKVTDASDGAPVTQGKATATAPDGSTSEVNISKLANYRIFSLAAGSYTLTVESPGYVTQLLEHVVVEFEGITTLDIEMVKE